jgi:hypothetical protein
MAPQAQRIAAIEQQMEYLQGQLQALASGLRYAFEAGRDSVLAPPAPQPRTRHLHLVHGGRCAEAERQLELEAGA